MSTDLHSPDELTQLAVAALMQAGVSRENAEPVASALVAAELDGLASHGLSRLPFYADQAASGKVDGQAEPAVSVNGAVVNVDARSGFAYRPIRLGLASGVETARKQGIAAVAVANSHHFGVAGHHVEQAAEQGMVTLAFGNTPAAMAPWGGNTPLFGTNPIAFAAPRGSEPPLVIDLSLSKVARGKIMVASKSNEAIPEGWALDVEGRPTTDPKAALAGSMIPLGDAKGSALALMVELLSAGLTGSNFGFEASSFFEAEGAPPRVAQLFLLLDPAHFGGAEVFAERMATMASAIDRQPGARLPGMRRLGIRAEKAAGISVSAPLLADLRKRAAAS